MALNFKPSAEAAKEAAAEITPTAEVRMLFLPRLYQAVITPRKTLIRP